MASELLDPKDAAPPPSVLRRERGPVVVSRRVTPVDLGVTGKWDASLCRWSPQVRSPFAAASAG